MQGHIGTSSVHQYFISRASQKAGGGGGFGGPLTASRCQCPQTDSCWNGTKLVDVGLRRHYAHCSGRQFKPTAVGGRGLASIRGPTVIAPALFRPCPAADILFGLWQILSSFKIFGGERGFRDLHCSCVFVVSASDIVQQSARIESAGHRVTVQGDSTSRVHGANRRQSAPANVCRPPYCFGLGASCRCLRGQHLNPKPSWPCTPRTIHPSISPSVNPHPTRPPLPSPPLPPCLSANSIEQRLAGWPLVAVGGWWRLAVGGPWGLSLRGVLVVKKTIGTFLSQRMPPPPPPSLLHIVKAR